MKEVNITLGVLMRSAESLQNLSQLKLPINLSFRLSTFLEEIQPKLSNGFQKQKEIIESSKSDIEKTEELKALMEESLIFNAPELSIDELGKGLKAVYLSPADLLSLNWLIDG